MDTVILKITDDTKGVLLTNNETLSREFVVTVKLQKHATKEQNKELMDNMKWLYDRYIENVKG